MKILCIAVIALAAALHTGAQARPATHYYTAGSEEGIFIQTDIPEEAAYAEDTSRSADGITTVVMKTVPGGSLVRKEQYKGNTPVGKWLQHYSNDAPAIETVYDIEPAGTIASCATPFIFELGGTALSFNKGSTTFTPPVLQDGRDLRDFINDNLHYPAAAREHNVQGTVRIKGTLTETGELEDLAISKCVDRDLDAEVFRVAKKIRFKGPALVDGRPARLCVSMPVTFALQ